MSVETGHEDGQILAAVEGLGGGEAGAGERRYVELLGILPYALDPVEPRPEVKERLMAAVEEAARPHPVVDIHARRPRPAEAAAAAAPVARGARRGSWTVALAAVAAVAVFGVAFLAGRSSEQAATIAQLRADIAAARGEEAALRDAQAELLEVKHNFEMITTVAQEAYPMRVVHTTDAGIAPEGIVFVCGNHQQWYLNLRGLAPPPAGREYHLWFITAAGARDGGVLDVEPDAPAERGAPTMPDGTRGFAVTLETAGHHDRPEGETILLGDRPVAL